MSPGTFRGCVVSGLLFGFAVLEAAWAAEPSVAVPKAKTRAEIGEALAKLPAPIWAETPLTDVLDDLSHRSGIPMRLDARRLEDSGVDPDTPITFNVPGTSAKVALDMALRDHDLTTLLCEGVLLITTREAADSMLSTKVYEVADLVSTQDENGNPSADFDQLIDVITATIEPATWYDTGGPGSLRGFQAKGIQALVVNQTDAVHEKVEDLLRQLRAVRGTSKPDAPTPAART
jgi:hypothetical protein